MRALLFAFIPARSWERQYALILSFVSPTALAMVGELVRSVVGLSQQAANEAFSRFLQDNELDSQQMHFVRQIVNYIIRNGMMKDLSVLQESPFNDMGSITELFDMSTFMNIRRVIDGININAAA